jgi:hypothetical protein
VRRLVVACVLLALSGCGHRDSYRGGVYANFTFAPAPRDTAREVNDAIARDERVLAEDAAVDAATLKTTLKSLVQRLCDAHDERERRRVVETYARRVPGLSDVTLNCKTEAAQSTLQPHGKRLP